MKMFDKIRDLFTEEVEVETPVKKEVIQVEIPAPEQKKEEVTKIESKEDFITQPIRQEVRKPAPVAPVSENKTDEKFNYPVFFDEKDFDDIKKEETIPVVESKRELPAYRELTPSREVYGVKKNEEKKDDSKFHPTPIISPVYGVLDKNYVKEDIVDKPKRSTIKNNPNITIDDVRNKAYGTLEDELENTLFGKTSILFASKDEEEVTSTCDFNDNQVSEEIKENHDNRHEYSDIESDLKDTADALELLKENHIPKHKMKDNEDTISDYKERHTEKSKRTRKTKIIVEEEPESESLVGDQLENGGIDLEASLTDSNKVDKNTNSEEIDDYQSSISTNLVEDELNKDFESDSKLSDSDLFNLIDDMYGKGDK